MFGVGSGGVGTLSKGKGAKLCGLVVFNFNILHKLELRLNKNCTIIRLPNADQVEHHIESMEKISVLDLAETLAQCRQLISEETAFVAGQKSVCRLVRPVDVK